MKKIILFLSLFSVVFPLFSDSETLYSNGFENPDDLPLRYFHFDWWEGFKTRVTTHHLAPAPAPLLTGYDLGKQSFKIDFTFNGSGKTMHLYLKPEKDFLITDPMTQSAYIKIEEASGLKVEVGAYVVYGEPHIPGKQATVGHWSKEKAFIPADASELPNGWTYTTLNLAQKTKQFARRLKFNSKDAYYGGLLVMISGQKGQTIKKGDRITLYIDDISIQKSGLSSRMSDPKLTDSFYLLGERNRYEVRNRLYRKTVDGNSVRNGGFELGMEGWDYSRRGKSDMIHKELSDDAAQGSRSLKITHDTETDSLLWSDIVHLRKDGNYPVSFLAKADGEMKIGGQKISSGWKLYKVPIWWLSKGTRGNVVPYIARETEQKYVMLPIEGKGCVWIDSVSTDPARTPEKYRTLSSMETAVGFDDARTLCNVFSDKNPFSINLYFWNGGNETGEFRMKYSIRDFYGACVSEGNFSETLSSDAGFKRDIPFPRGKRGIFYVYLSAESPSGKKTDSENACAVIEQLDSLKLNSDSIFGLSKPGAQQYDKMLELARKIGSKGLNQNGIMETVWSTTMKDWRERKAAGKPIFSYPVAGGERDREILDAGMEPLYLTRGMPAFLRPGFPYAYPDGPLSPEVMKEYSEIVELFAREMDPARKRSFDLFPEGCADEKRIILMKPYVKVVSEALRRASSESEVLGCGFWDVSMMGKQVEWAAKHGYFKEGLLDGVTIHPYAVNPDVSYMDSGLRHVRKTLDSERPGMPIVAAEVGYQNLTTFYSDIRGSEVQGWNSIHSEERTAEYLARMMLIGLRHKVKRIMVFPALSAGSMPWPHHFGIVYNNMNRPKAGLPALSGLTSQIHDAEFVSLASPQKEYTAQVMKRDRGDWILALWSFSDDKSLTTAVSVPAIKNLRFIDLMNNEFVPENGKFILHGGSPVMIVSRTRESLERVVKEMKFEPHILLPKLVIKKRKLFLLIENKTLTDALVKIDFSKFPPSWSSSERSFQLNVPAGKTFEREIRLPDGEKISLEADVRTRNGIFKLKHRPLIVPRLSNVSGSLKDNPSVLKISLGKNELRWGNGRDVREHPVTLEDLSGSFYCAYDSKALYLAFDVKDSRFYQPYDGAGIWKGDSVQIAFDPLCNTNSLTRSYLFDDSEIGIALLANGRTEIVRYFGKDSLLKNLKASVRKTADGLYYEIVIPWKNLDIVPENGTKIGFNFVVNDNDGKSDAPEKYLTLPPGGIAEPMGKVPFLFHDLILQ